jgi:fructose-bisphosphate aldolase class I
MSSEPPSSKRLKTNGDIVENGDEGISNECCLCEKSEEMLLSLYPHLKSEERRKELLGTAMLLGTHGKGITACDESAGTIGKRFEAVGVENTEENRRAYRQMLLDTDGIEEYLCGAILDPETLTQKSNRTDETFPEILKKRNIAVGVKPHLKVYELPGCNGDTVMQGLDSLAVRCRLYYSQGARFAKWRSPIFIDVPKGQPSALAIRANMEDLARYALICQSEGLMPIVEPDIVIKGTSQTLEQATKIAIQVQAHLYNAMVQHNVYMEGTTLKPSMVLPGEKCKNSYSLQQIAHANLHVLQSAMPAAMPAVNYLSGGQSLAQACARLHAINYYQSPTTKNQRNKPWNLSFSWSAAIQLPIIDLCRDQKSMPLSQMATLYLDTLKLASKASTGTYDHSLALEDGQHKGYLEK